MGTPWTENEKLGLLFQIIEKAGPIKYDELTLPEGRTKKAVQVMIDKEKTRIRKAKEGGAQDGQGQTTPSGKRKADANSSTPTKSPKTPRKNKKKIEQDETNGVKGEAGDDAEGLKAEPKDESD